MTEADLGRKSIPRNPLLFGMLYRMDAVEHIGSGIKRIKQICADYGVVAPEIQVEEDWFTVSFPRVSATATTEVTPQVSPEVTPEVGKILTVIQGEMSRMEIQNELGLIDEKHFREHYQQPAIAMGLIEMTVPDKPRSSRQKYRLTEEGRKLIEVDKK